MATYLCVKVSNTTKKFTAKESKEAGKPYLRVPGGYFPLTTETTTGTQLKVRANNTNYRIVETYTTTRQGQTTSQSTSSDFLSTYSVGQEYNYSSSLISFVNTSYERYFTLTMSYTYQYFNSGYGSGVSTTKERVTAHGGTYSFIGYTYKHDIDGGIFDKYKSGSLVSWLRNSSNGYRYTSYLAVYDNLNNYMFEVVKTRLNAELFMDRYGGHGKVTVSYMDKGQARVTIPPITEYAYCRNNTAVYSQFFKLDSHYRFEDLTSSYLYNGFQADMKASYLFGTATNYMSVFSMRSPEGYISGTNLNPTIEARILDGHAPLDETWSVPGTHMLKTRFITAYSAYSSIYVSTDTITYNTTYQSTYTTQ